MLCSSALARPVDQAGETVARLLFWVLFEAGDDLVGNFLRNPGLPDILMIFQEILGDFLGLDLVVLAPGQQLVQFGVLKLYPPQKLVNDRSTVLDGVGHYGIYRYDREGAERWLFAIGLGIA